MNAREFVEAVFIAVYRDTASDILELVTHPPLRLRDKDLVALSDWYAMLPPEDRCKVERIGDMIAESATQRALCLS
jgi:hypothetical protein